MAFNDLSPPCIHALKESTLFDSGLSHVAYVS